MSAPTYEQREGSEITEYPGFAVEFRAASHRYWLIEGGERTAAISVTSALKIIDKPALVGWGERMGCEGALRLERDGELQGVPVEEAIDRVRALKMGADAKRDAGADRGTAVHEALRLYCSEGVIPNVGDFPLEVRGYVQGLAGWLVAKQPEPIQVEQIVGSPEHGFAGRFDLLAMIDGQRTIADLKTSVRIFPEHHLQTAAYMLALEECEGREAAADRGLIVAVAADGSFTEAVCCSEPSQFLSVLACHRAVSAVRRSVKSMEKVARA